MRGATRECNGTDLCRHSFNPRVPCGARPLPSGLPPMQARFQSTRPMRGATCCHDAGGDAGRVSIHAPHAGRDRDGDATTGTCDVSIHAPHAGRDHFCIRDFHASNVSIHAPHAGRDCFSFLSRIVFAMFQSTRPMRGATPLMLVPCAVISVSIHAPHAGRDIAVSTSMTVRQMFQSTRPMRGATRVMQG